MWVWQGKGCNHQLFSWCHVKLKALILQCFHRLWVYGAAFICKFDHVSPFELCFWLHMFSLISFVGGHDSGGYFLPFCCWGSEEVFEHLANAAFLLYAEKINNACYSSIKVFPNFYLRLFLWFHSADFSSIYFPTDYC